ncbi:MAG: hypothetical protein AB1345_01985 [Chloroflexota bacterium]
MQAVRGKSVALDESIWKQMKSLVLEFGEDVFEAIFAVTQKSAKRRRQVLMMLFVLIWVLLAYLGQPDFWRQLSHQSLDTIASYLARLFFGAPTLRRVLLLMLSFWLANHIAALYISDIFELGEEKVALRYVRQASLGSKYSAIKIRNGDVDPGDKSSPIYLIGGPGRVAIYLENAAVFEKINGKPNIIAPKGKEKNAAQKKRSWWQRLYEFFQNSFYKKPSDGKEEKDDFILEGFERLRAVIDLRSHQARLEVASRSRDGIKVCAKDVRLTYSVHRGGISQTKKQPYPFTEKAIKDLIYRQGEVEGGHRGWVRIMERIICEGIEEFISDHNLNEFLAAPRGADYDAIRNIGEISQEMREGRFPRGMNQATYQPESFFSRPEITSELRNSVALHAAEKGVQLEWIGIGTWVTPSEIITTEHLEALKLSIENQKRGNKQALEQLERENRRSEITRHIQEVPVAVYRECKGEGENHEDTLIRLIEAYMSKLDKVIRLYPDRKQKGYDYLLEAERYLSRLCRVRWS